MTGDGETGAAAAAGPVFVCGPSRSGTALVRSILNLHPRVFLAGETHYFDDLRPRLGDEARTPVADVRRRMVEDYLLALSHRPYGHHGDPEKGRVRRADLHALADELGSSGDAHLEAYCRIEARANGRDIWGEKTPRHVYRIPELLEAFPGARVICLVRDARAIVASYRDWRNQGGFDFENDPGGEAALEADHERARRSYHPVTISLLWRGAMRAAIAAQGTFGAARVRLQRYERLAQRSEAEVRELAEWLGLAFEPAMAAPPMSNSSYARFEVKAGVSSESVDRWRDKLSPGEIATVESVCGPTLRELGYDLVAPRGTRSAVAWQWTTFPVFAARAALVNRRRIAGLPSYVMRRLFPRTR